MTFLILMAVLYPPPYRWKNRGSEANDMSQAFWSTITGSLDSPHVALVPVSIPLYPTRKFQILEFWLEASRGTPPGLVTVVVGKQTHGRIPFPMSFQGVNEGQASALLSPRVEDSQ